MSSFQQKTCSKCGLHPAAGNQLRRCGSCLAVKYCSSTCQTEDWASHKLVCKKVGAARKEELMEELRPLIVAAKDGNVATVKKLLKAGAKVDGGTMPDTQETLVRITPPAVHGRLGWPCSSHSSAFEGGCQDEQNNCCRLHASICGRTGGAQGSCIGAHRSRR